MKKNSITYLLIVLVFVVWGVVFYNIFNPSDKNKTEEVSASVQPRKKEHTRPELSLNYRDPFRVRRIEEKKIVETHQEVKVIEEPPMFRYMGLIKGVKNKVIIIEKNGVSELIPRSDSLLSYKILSINNDSVVLRKAGIRYSLIRN